MTGQHPCIKSDSKKYSEEAAAITICKIEIHPETNLDFWQVDGMGAKPTTEVTRSREDQQELKS